MHRDRIEDGLNRCCAADLALRRRWVTDALEDFEDVPVRTLVFIRGHDRTNASSGFGADTLGHRESVVTELAVHSRAFARTPARELAPRSFAIAIALTA